MPDASGMTPLPPGSTIGILGSGQLGRMLATAAARIDLKTHIYCEESGPAFDVATRTTRAAFNDTAALTAFAREVDAVTLEFENVAVETARHLARHLPVRPGAKALEVAQDRLKEKEFIAALDIAVAPFRAIDAAAQLPSALGAFAGPAILKSRKLGYDGKGQAPISPGDDADAAWRKVGAVPAVLEKRVAFALELSVLVVRGASGELAFYDSPRNTHEGGILRRSVVPSGVLQDDLSRARDMAGAIARALDYVGVLAIEFFIVGEELLANEMAPRVHNSGHWTIDGAVTSQFENHVRAVAGLPLGDPSVFGASRMLNIIGEQPEAAALLAIPGAHLHHYGKAPRPGRKLGHVTIVGDVPDLMEARFQAARRIVGDPE